ncbi:DUF4283 domain-containing protein [Cephalotus follicularis]|uniref:DUF4283 domain-containing protein n=1 Tax=Cephalotus follicularis TaxID=3775 RepID=A0A1Q3ARZ8_CEPFO|nr:DUF4283 domain-containing protein [Cephalotus follicularis]
MTGEEQCDPPPADPTPPPSSLPSSSATPAPHQKISYKSALGRPASEPLIPLSQLPEVPKIPINPKSPSSFNGKPLVNLSPQDVKLASEFHAFSLIAKFSLQRPPVDLFEHHVNSSWGLQQPATVGLLDPKHILIHLHSADDFSKAWSRESRVFDNRRFLLLRWTPIFSKRKDSSLSAMWMRLPGLPLLCQNPSILEVIGNSIGRFLLQDERTKRLKHPMSPRLCVEMDLAVKLPEEVVIAVGTEEIYHQKIEYDQRIGFCTFCLLQGHLDINCRKKQNQANTDGNAAATRGNVNSTLNVSVVNAVQPENVHRPRARRPNRTQPADHPSSISHPPTACEFAQVNLSLQPATQSPAATHNPTHPFPPHPTQAIEPAILNDDGALQSDEIPFTVYAPQSSCPIQIQDKVNDTQLITLHNKFDLLTTTSDSPSQAALGVSSLPLEPSNSLSPLMTNKTKDPTPVTLQPNPSISPSHQNTAPPPNLLAAVLHPPPPQ